MTAGADLIATAVAARVLPEVFDADFGFATGFFFVRVFVAIEISLLE
jgi:hypothetical protein